MESKSISILALPNELLLQIAAQLFENSPYRHGGTNIYGRGYGHKDRCNFRRVCKAFAKLVSPEWMFGVLQVDNSIASVKKFRYLDQHPAKEHVTEFRFSALEAYEVLPPSQSTLDDWLQDGGGGGRSGGGGNSKVENNYGVSALGIVPGAGLILSTIHRLPAVSSVTLTFPEPLILDEDDGFDSEGPDPNDWNDDDWDRYAVDIEHKRCEHIRGTFEATDSIFCAFMHSSAHLGSRLTSLTLENIGTSHLSAYDMPQFFRSLVRWLKHLKVTFVSCPVLDDDCEPISEEDDEQFGTFIEHYIGHVWLPAAPNLLTFSFDGDTEYHQLGLNIGGPVGKNNPQLRELTLGHCQMNEFITVGILSLSDCLERLVFNECETYWLIHENSLLCSDWELFLDMMKRGMRKLNSIEFDETCEMSEQTKTAVRECQQWLASNTAEQRVIEDMGHLIHEELDI